MRCSGYPSKSQNKPASEPQQNPSHKNRVFPSILPCSVYWCIKSTCRGWNPLVVRGDWGHRRDHGIGKLRGGGFATEIAGDVSGFAVDLDDGGFDPLRGGALA
jgi:hypothetical protein